MNCENQKPDLKLCVGVEQTALTAGLKIPVWVDFCNPHLLLSAPSGSGKTYLLTWLLSQLAQKPGQVVLADFKGIDFIEMDGCKNYFRHDAVAEALNIAFDTLQARMHDPGKATEPLFCVVDEWSGFISFCQKKEQTEYLQKMASLLMLGRGAGVFVIMALQRADANYITGRDNFGNALGLGRQSNEAIRMLFQDEADQIQPKGRGHGYLRTDGKPLREIVVPRIRDMKKLKEQIRAKLQ
ncbi:type IV secretory system conjugative DNA transfer family protein [Lawsonibacter sp. JLR.KK007]|uniref:type IV secretory system conjugative DNA transfer family protein n=1 Tax=Lawsonibacter sp. JLR.KK007 TaxID=3114293 RepID=UPI002FF04FA0